MSDHVTSLPEYALANGRLARLRPIRSDDAPRLIALFQRLSDETIRYRFFITKKELLPHEAQHFANVDYRERMAIVAESTAGNDVELVGVARYDSSNSTQADRAEFAIVVEDRFQGQGLGKVLLRELAKAARANGIRYLAGDTLADNQNMLRFLRGCGFPVKLTRDGTEMHFVLDVALKD